MNLFQFMQNIKEDRKNVFTLFIPKKCGKQTILDHLLYEIKKCKNNQERQLILFELSRLIIINNFCEQYSYLLIIYKENNPANIVSYDSTIVESDEDNILYIWHSYPVYDLISAADDDDNVSIVSQDLD